MKVASKLKTILMKPSSLFMLLGCNAKFSISESFFIFSMIFKEIRLGVDCLYEVSPVPN